MKVKLLARSPEGLWSVGSLAAEILFFLFFYLQVTVFEQRGGETIFSNLYLALPMLGAALAGIAALCLSLAALIRRKDFAVTVFISLLIGALTTLWVVIQFVFAD